MEIRNLVTHIGLDETNPLTVYWDMRSYMEPATCHPDDLERNVEHREVLRVKKVEITLLNRISIDMTEHFSGTDGHSPSLRKKLENALLDEVENESVYELMRQS